MAIDKRQIVFDLAQEKTREGYTPAAFFLRFPAEFHIGSAAVAKHEEFFRFTDMDLAKIQFEVPLPTFPIATAADWDRLPAPEPKHFEPQLEVVKGVVDRLSSEAVVVLTLYSPFMIAGGMGGHDALDAHLREAPKKASSAIGRVADGLAQFVEACVQAGLDGFYMSTQGGESLRFPDGEVFERYIKPHDLRVMRLCDDLARFNILHICDYHRSEFGPYDSLDAYLEYPGDLINVWTGNFEPGEVERKFGRPFMGGMDRHGSLSKGGHDEIRIEAREALAQGVRFLSADCTVPGDTPWENLQTAIRAAHGQG